MEGYAVPAERNIAAPERIHRDSAKLRDPRNFSSTATNAVQPVWCLAVVIRKTSPKQFRTLLAGNSGETVTEVVPGLPFNYE